ncbi:hypothetical protein FXF51_11935 [Nonomuraea sp. PA05]|uniref:hypothetical protein n=1 Tax=Nonomuraea sp. PA05 TaxID=2604466 RepID=UPI0011D975DD|nr:hypothetical protein [Nonomuraea sp. PA05]TYB68533.1 hypothetical protein FXF51_11935 [Nonomuraea sp. PA05]
MKHALVPAAALLVVAGVAAIGCGDTVSTTGTPHVIPMPGRPAVPAGPPPTLVQPPVPVPTPLPAFKPEPALDASP